MKKIYKLATLLIVLCMCFVITGCFGTVNTMTKKYSEAREQSQKTNCKSNLTNIATACEMYAADHEGRYPKNLDEITKNGYMRVLPKCPICDEEYKFVSKYIKIDDKNVIDYYILKCQKHPIRFDSIMGRMDLENADARLKKYYQAISNGKIKLKLRNNQKNTFEITFTDDELKELGIK